MISSYQAVTQYFALGAQSDNYSYNSNDTPTPSPIPQSECTFNSYITFGDAAQSTDDLVEYLDKMVKFNHYCGALHILL